MVARICAPNPASAELMESHRRGRPSRSWYRSPRQYGSPPPGTGHQPSSAQGPLLPVTTVAALLLARRDDEHTGLRFEEQSWTWTEVVRESEARAALLRALRMEGPFHVGVLLE